MPNSRKGRAVLTRDPQKISHALPRATLVRLPFGRGRAHERHCNADARFNLLPIPLQTRLVKAIDKPEIGIGRQWWHRRIHRWLARQERVRSTLKPRTPTFPKAATTILIRRRLGHSASNLPRRQNRGRTAWKIAPRPWEDPAHAIGESAHPPWDPHRQTPPGERK